MQREHRVRWIAASLLMTSPVHAQVVIPNSTTTVTLQTLDPAATDFVLPVGGTVETTDSEGVVGDNSRDWNVVNRGAITAVNKGVALQGATGAFRFENFGSVSSSGEGSNGGSASVALLGPGMLINHEGGSITAVSDAVYVQDPGATVQNDGTLRASLSDRTAVFLSQGGTFIQGATGRLFGGYGVIFNSGTAAGSNAGVIEAQNDGVWLRGGASGAFDNTGGTIIGSISALRLSAGSVLDLQGGTLAASGTRSQGMAVTGAGARLVARDLEVGVNGEEANAVFVGSGGAYRTVQRRDHRPGRTGGRRGGRGGRLGQRQRRLAAGDERGRARRPHPR